jgi:UDP-N-acetylmuramyl-tripeptide synthetase
MAAPASVTPTPLHHLADAAQAAAWLATRVRGPLRTDSRWLEPGDGFIAWPGRVHDARAHVSAALAAGAAACLVEAEGAEAFAFDDERIAALPGLKAAAGDVANAFFAQPSAVLDIVASTGTNGKTSTAWWTAQALTALGRRCGVMGTLGVGEPPAVGAGAGAGAGAAVQPLLATGLTTPDPVAVHAALRHFVDLGFAACALEASSIGLLEGRLGAVQISVALFTNLTRDHLDYHGSMAAYWDAKRLLFAWPGLKAAVVNIDDAHGALLAKEVTARMAGAKTTSAIDLFTVSLRQPARLQAHGLRYLNGGLAFEVTEGPQRVTVSSSLVGDFNANNLLCVLGALRALGVPLAQAAAVLAHVTAVPGRLQRVALAPQAPLGAGIAVRADAVATAPIEVLVDYAHTPDALDKTLQALRPLAAVQGGRLWCVFGCGGNRDASKRPLMGGIAARGADLVVLTSDNPRDEVPATILAQIAAGMDTAQRQRTVVIEDRRQAIQHAVLQAQLGDVLLLAGKGHETTQEAAGVKRPFSDVEEAQAAWALRPPSKAQALPGAKPPSTTGAAA